MKKVFLVAVFGVTFVIRGLAYDNVIDPSQNPHGLVFGADNVVLNALQEKAKSELGVDIDRYYTVSLTNRESCTQTFTNPESFVVWIPSNAAQYGMELEYTKDGKEIFKESRLAGTSVLIRGPDKGETLLLKITRAPKLE